MENCIALVGMMKMFCLTLTQWAQVYLKNVYFTLNGNIV